MTKEIENLKKTIKEQKELLEYDKKIILEKILENSSYLESVKEEVDIYRKSKETIDKHSKLLDKINSMRDMFLDIAETKYPELYDEFVKDIYDDPYDVLVFITAFVKEIAKE